MPRTAHQYADVLLAESLAVGKTVVEAARTAGVSERTAYRRLKEPAVRARVAEVRRAALDAVAGRLTHGMVAACDHLTRLVGHDNPHVQIRAAKTVLQLALQVRQAVDVEDRLGQLGDQTRLPPVAPAVAAVGPRPVALGPGKDPVERSDHTGRDGEVDSPIKSEMKPDAPASVIEGGTETTACGGLDRGEPATPTDSPGRTAWTSSRDPEAGTHRADRFVSRVVVGLLVALGLSFAATGTARTHPEPAADHRVRTCQNLPEPATRSTIISAPKGCDERTAGTFPQQAWARTAEAASSRSKSISRPAPTYLPTGRQSRPQPQKRAARYCPPLSG